MDHLMTTVIGAKAAEFFGTTEGYHDRLLAWQTCAGPGCGVVLWGQAPEHDEVLQRTVFARSRCVPSRCVAGGAHPAADAQGGLGGVMSHFVVSRGRWVRCVVDGADV